MCFYINVMILLIYSQETKKAKNTKRKTIK
nr:MAG TPA: hypothetical protein [Caudoviricetes sp.]